MIGYFLAILAAVVIIITTVVSYNLSAGERAIAEARASAIKIEAESNAQVRLNYSLIPYAVILALAIPGTILALKYQPRQVIEKRVIFEIERPAEPPLSRRQVWDQLTTNARAELTAGPEIEPEMPEIPQTIEIERSTSLQPLLFSIPFLRGRQRLGAGDVPQITSGRRSRS